MDTGWTVILCVMLVLVGFVLGFTAGYDSFAPNEHQMELIDKTCKHIYETESIEVYTQYCK